MALVVALAASVAASLIVYGQQTATISSLSSELAQKSLQVDEYGSLVATQREELTVRGAQLEELRDEISTLDQEIKSQEKLIATKSAQTEQLEASLATNKAELAQLQLQFASLEQQISTLQSEIQAKDADLAELILENASSRRVHVDYFGLGVDENDNGIVFPMEVEIISSGAGRISVDVSHVQYESGFQESVRTAAIVAAKHTGVPVSDKDIIIRLVGKSSDLIKVDGPSAGAAITVMMVAGLTEKQLDDSVLVTGSIRSDGTIGKVGGLFGKASAAADHGATKLLVPKGQEFQDGRIEIEGVANIGQLASRVIV